MVGLKSNYGGNYIMEDLVFYHGFKSEPYTTVNIISQFTYIKMQSINDLIRNHKIKFEKLGVLRFEIVKPMKGQFLKTSY